MRTIDFYTLQKHDNTDNTSLTPNIGHTPTHFKTLRKKPIKKRVKDNSKVRKYKDYKENCSDLMCYEKLDMQNVLDALNREIKTNITTWLLMIIFK